MLALSFSWAYALAAAVAALTLTLTIHYSWVRGVPSHPHPLRSLRRWLHAHGMLAMLCALLGGALGGAGAVQGLHVLSGPMGLVEPPVAAQTHVSSVIVGQKKRHGLGFMAQHGHLKAGSVGQGQGLFGAAAPPASVDLSADAPSPGDQGTLNSCVSWSVGYGLLTYYARRAGHPLPGGGAPMYLYAQVAHGQDRGTTFPRVLRLLVAGGIDARARYAQGDYDYLTLPTRQERRRARAALPLLRSWRPLFIGAGQGPGARLAIERELMVGNPVGLGLPVYDTMERASRTSYYIASAGGTLWGNHAVVAYKYDLNGVWIESSWGLGWGLGGWAEVSWPYIEQWALEADVLIPRS